MFLTKRILLILTFCTFSISGVLAANSFPPDTTTSIVDKGLAVAIISEGKTLYSEGKIKDALTKFREAAIKDPNSWKANYWQGKCHYKLKSYGYAVKYAKAALDIESEKVDKEIYFLLGLAYHSLENLDTAIINYEKALEVMPKNRIKVLQVQENLDHCKYAKEIMKNSALYERYKIPGRVNSGYDEYGVIFTDSAQTLYFTSRRNNTTGGGLNPDDQLFFEDIYTAKYDAEMKSFEDVHNDLGRLNTDGFDALNYMSDDGMYGVMTLNTTALDIKKTTRGSDICEIVKNKKGLYNSPRIIKNKTINTSFFEGSATLTADGNTMYFITDRKGEKSSTDIYMVEKVGKKWGEAKPLPFTINTKGRETTPFISPDGRFLFFSSDGHIGMGGLDIFVVENKGGEWGLPVNMGYGINTVNHDTHFVWNSVLEKGYVSGIEVVGNKSSMDIYEMDFSNFEIPKSEEE